MIVITGNAPYVVSKYALGQNEDGLSNIRIVGDETDGYYIGFVSPDDESKTLTLDQVTSQIMKELKENGDVLKDYISEDEKKQKELLKKLIKADIYTKYPRFNDDKDKLQGCINIVRNDENKTRLKYKTYKEFKQLITNTDTDTNIMNYYSLNDDGNLVVASKTETKFIDGENENSPTITMKESPVDITTNLNKYALSFDYLWALLVETGDIEFVENIIDLVLKSNIEITVFEEEKTTTTYTVEQHTEQKIGNKSAKFLAWDDDNSENPNILTVNGGTVCSDIETKEYKEIKQVKNVTQITHITNAKLWFCDYTKEYGKEVEESGSDSFPEPEETGQNEQIQDITQDIQSNQDIAWCSDEYYYFRQANKFENYSAETIYTYNQMMYDNFKSGQNTYTKSIGYIEQPSEGVIEKTDKNSENDNFVTYLVKSKKALDELKITDDWFYEMLEENERTDYMIDITKYLMYKATGKDYGVKDFSFDEYDPNKFSDVTVITGNSIQEKVWFALKDLGYSEVSIAGAMGNIHYESGGFSAAAIEGNGEGNGLCQWSFGRKEQLHNFAASKGKDWTDEDVQIEFLIGELTPGGGADGYATFQFTDYYYEQWTNTTDIKKATEAFCWGFERPNEDAGNTSMGTRTDWAQKYYNDFKGKTRPTGGSPSAENGDGYTQIFTSSSGKKYKEYKQFMGSYSREIYEYSGNSISYDGCSITAIAITISGYNSSITPGDLRYSGVLISHYNNNNVSCEKTRGDINKIKDNLKDGKPVVVPISGTLYAGGASKYYGEHYIALLDINADGQVYVSDPGSIDTNGWADLNDIVNIIDDTDAGAVFYINQ